MRGGGEGRNVTYAYLKNAQGLNDNKALHSRDDFDRLYDSKVPKKSEQINTNYSDQKQQKKNPRMKRITITSKHKWEEKQLY